MEKEERQKPIGLSQAEFINEKCPLCGSTLLSDGKAKWCSLVSSPRDRSCHYNSYLQDEPEAIEHPQHYGGDTTYETIKVLRAWLTPEQFVGFCLGNTLKYLSRAGKKGEATEDWKKARFYLNYLIEQSSDQH